MPRSDLLVLDKKDKSCANPNGKTFNGYIMNKQQNANAGNTINFNDAKVQKALSKDAVSSCTLLFKTEMSTRIKNFSTVTYSASSLAT